jgi:hypothetical protein
MNTSSFESIIVNEIRDYGLLQDRLPGDQVVLPVEWESIKIKPNDFVLVDSINNSIEQLYRNWLYLLSYSVIPTNDIPDVLRGDRIVTDKGDGVEWGFLSQDIREPDSELSGTNHVVKIQNTIDPNNFNLITATQTNVMLLSGTGTINIDVITNPDTLRLDSNGEPILDSIVRSDSSITHPSNGIFFQNIIDIDVNKDKELFVLDDVHKTVFKFDISGITSLDEAILKNDTPGRLLTRMVGGSGILNDKIRFLSPVCLTVVDNDIYVLDQDPSSKECVLKHFDSHLNWKNNFSLGVFDTQPAIDIEYNYRFNSFHIICNDETLADVAPTITSFDSSLNKVSTEDLMNFQRHDGGIATEIYRKLYFSLENENIMYIVTDKNIYKKYLSRPTSFIGRFRFEDREIGSSVSDRSLRDISIHTKIQDDGSVMDEILLFEQHNNTLYRFVEDSGFQNSLESEIDQSIMLFDQLRLDPDDNVDVITYNKMLYKVLYNNMMLLENISRKFATFFDDKGISQYLGFRYLNIDDLKSLNYDVKLDNYISNNEIILSATVNRCLKRLHELQLLIAENMQEKSINVFPDPSKTVILS